MQHNIYVYMFIMAAVTYAIRVLPLTLIRKEIKSKFIRSFLYYVPYVTLSVMTFPAIIEATDSPVAGAVAFVSAILLACVSCADGPEGNRPGNNVFDEWKTTSISRIGTGRTADCGHTHDASPNRRSVPECK